MKDNKPDIITYIVGLGLAGAITITGSMAIQNSINRLGAKVERIMQYDTQKNGLDRAEFRNVFDELDSNKNGVIESGEVYDYLGYKERER